MFQRPTCHSATLPNLALVVLAALVAFASVGCARRTVHGERVGVARENAYRGFLVFCDAHDENLRRTLEDRVVGELGEEGLAARSSLTLLTEPRPYSEDEVLRIMGVENLDALVRLRVQRYETDLVERPGPIVGFGVGWTYVETQGAPWYEERQHLRVGLDLLDRDGRTVAWQGRALVVRHGDHNLADLSSELAEDLVDHLADERLIERRRR